MFSVLCLKILRHESQSSSVFCTQHNSFTHSPVGRAFKEVNTLYELCSVDATLRHTPFYSRLCARALFGALLVSKRSAAFFFHKIHSKLGHIQTVLICIAPGVTPFIKHDTKVYVCNICYGT